MEGLNMLCNSFQAFVDEYRILHKANLHLPINFYIFDQTLNKSVFSNDTILKELNLSPRDGGNMHFILRDIMSPQDIDLFDLRISSLNSFSGSASSFDLNLFLPNKGWQKVGCKLTRLLSGKRQVVMVILEGIKKDNLVSLRVEKSVAQLTLKESKILFLISDGLTNKEISKEMNIAPTSAGTYRKRLLEKTGCPNSASLVRWGFCNGYLSRD